MKSEQQADFLRELNRILGLLSKVTWLARELKVSWVVGAASRKGLDVINMSFSFKRLAAVGTFVPLKRSDSANVVGCEAPCGVTLPGLSAYGPSSDIILVGFPIFFDLGLQSVFVGRVVGPDVLTALLLFFIGWLPALMFVRVAPGFLLSLIFCPPVRVGIQGLKSLALALIKQVAVFFTPRSNIGLLSCWVVFSPSCAFCGKALSVLNTPSAILLRVGTLCPWRFLWAEG